MEETSRAGTLQRCDNPRLLARCSPLLMGSVAGLIFTAPLDAQTSSWTHAISEARSLSPVSSVLVSQGGDILVEEYFRGMTADRRINVKSISKSLLSPLVGIAIRDGLLEGYRQPLAELLPEYLNSTEYGHWDGVTLHHLLSMTTGIRGTSFSRYGVWVSSPDWVAGALEQPTRCEPGSCWEYSTGNSHLVGVILARASGTDLRQYASTALFDRLDISLRAWDRDPQGNFLGGNNMALKPRDLLTFGELYVNEGRHHGEQLVPSVWIRRSWQEYAVSPWNGHSHGYFWWSREIDNTRVHFAWGYGGQYVLVVPEKNAVVVITSSLTQSTPRGHNRRVLEYFQSSILPLL